MGKEEIDKWLELVQDLNVSEAIQIMNVIASGLHENPHLEKLSPFIWLAYRMDREEIYQGLAALDRLVPLHKTKSVQFINLAIELSPEAIDRGLAALDRVIPRPKTKLEQFTDLARNPLLKPLQQADSAVVRIASVQRRRTSFRRTRIARRLMRVARRPSSSRPSCCWSQQ